MLKVNNMSYLWFVLTFMLVVQQGFAEEVNPLDLLEDRDSEKHCIADTENCKGLVNGECKNPHGYGWACGCKTGWTGTKCDKQVEKSVNPLDLLEDRDSEKHCIADTENCKGLVNGECKNPHGYGWACGCKTGWTGTKCDVKVENSPNSVRELLLNLLERDSENTCKYRTKFCSGHGACGKDARGVEYICYCSGGWGGVICDKPPKGHSIDNTLKELLDLLDEE